MVLGNTTETGINILDVLKGIGRHKVMILVLTVLALLASSFFVKTARPIYTSEAQLLIENLSSPYERSQNLNEISDPQVDDRTIQSQITVLKSNDITLKVIQQILTTHKEQLSSYQNVHVGTIKNLALSLGFGQDPRRMSFEQRVMADFSNSLSIYQIPNSNVIAIKFTSSSPQLTKEVANNLAQIYIQSSQEMRAQPTARAREWLAKQIESLRVKLSQSETAIEKFRASAGLLKGANATLGNQELTELNSQITLAETAKTEAQSRANAIKMMLASKGSIDQSLDVLNVPSIQRLREQQISARRKIAELSAIYLPNHPKMMAAQNELRNIDTQLRVEALNVVDGLADQATIATERQNALIQKLEKIKTKETTANIDDVQLRALERSAAADKSLLESLLLRYADASARQEVQPGIARIIQLADVPLAPSFPKPGPIILLVTLGCFVLALGFAFLLELIAQNSLIARDEAFHVTKGSPGHGEMPLALATPSLETFPLGLEHGAANAAQANQADANAPHANPPYANPPAQAQFQQVPGHFPVPPKGDIQPVAVVDFAEHTQPHAHTQQHAHGQATGPAGGAVQANLEVNRTLSSEWLGLGSQPLSGHGAAASGPGIVPLASISVPFNATWAGQSWVQQEAMVRNMLAPVYQQVSQWIAQVSSLRSVKSLTILSLGGGSGDAAFVAAALTRYFAHSGTKTIAVDMATVGEPLDRVLGLPPQEGLSDLMLGKSDFTKIVMRDIRSPAQVVSFGQQRTTQVFQLLSSKVQSVVQSLTRIFQLVILNAGEFSPYTPALLKNTDAVLLLAPQQRWADTTQAVAAMRASGIYYVACLTLRADLEFRVIEALNEPQLT